MKEIKQEQGPFLKSKQSTQKMMIHLLIALTPIFLFAFYKHGIIPFIHHKISIIGLFYPLLFLIVPALTCYLIEYLYYRFIKKLEINECKKTIHNSYSIIPGLFLALIMPINTPISIMIFGSVFTTVVGKLLFGGFGNNIFNPALIGRLFLITSYATVITSHGGYCNSYELDTIGGATPLSNPILLEELGTYDQLVSSYGSLWNFFLGTIPGAVGETSSILCLFALIYLIYFKVIKWRIPIFYLSTVFLLTTIIGNMNGLSIWYPLFYLLSGGLLFGSVFMATDPVTSPTTPTAQILYGIALGLLTVLLRYLTPYPEAVLTSILTMNLLVFLLDKIGLKARFSKKICYGSIIFLILCSLLSALLIGFSFQKEEENKDPNYHIVSKEKKDQQIIYTVTEKGYSSVIKAQIIFEQDHIVSIKILEQNDSFYDKITQTDFINQLLQEQENLEKLDTVSGATITSNALKKMIQNTIEDYRG